MDPSPIIELTTAYWRSQALFSANRAGIFTLLADQTLDIDTIASTLKIQKHPTELLLKACIALGFIEKQGDTYKNSALSQIYLVPGKQSFMGDAVSYGDDMYGVWGMLGQTLKSGKPALEPIEYLGKDKEKTKHFVYGMHNRALGIGQGLLGMVDLSDCHTLLDVGGGPGTYSSLLSKRFPKIQATVFDLPEIVAVAKDIIDDMEAGEKVRTMAGDYLACKAFPQGNDAVLMSGIFHRETRSTCRELIQKAHDSMKKGGLLMISDVFTDPESPNHLFATLFGLNMALSAKHGGVHSTEDVSSWLEDEGYENIEVNSFAPPMPHTVVQGRKR